jgi:hypothetical protein
MTHFFSAKREKIAVTPIDESRLCHLAAWLIFYVKIQNYKGE